MTVAKKSLAVAKTRARAPAKPTAAKPQPKAEEVTSPKAAAAKPVAPKVAKPVVAEKSEKAERAKKPKLVRDSFTIPKAEYQVLDELKQRAARQAHPVKKSELLRAGIKALAAMADAQFLAAVQAVPAIKTGRPKASGAKA